jgi:hypothetical protein
LRRERRDRALPGEVRTEPGGYVLELDDAETDVARFEHVVEVGLAAPAASAAGREELHLALDRRWRTEERHVRL